MNRINQLFSIKQKISSLFIFAQAFPTLEVVRRTIKVLLEKRD